MPILYQILTLIGWLALSFVASAIGLWASLNAPEFYSQLSQPSWAPPSAVFGPVWIVLYVLMGISAWLVWREDGFFAHDLALSLFLAQLVLNALWSWLFFGWHLGAWSFIDITVLWILILVTLITFWGASWIAGALMIPYLLWVSFAALLNYSIWQLNPQLLS